MERLRMFEIKYFGAGEKRGARVKITDTRNKKSITLKKHYNFDSSKDQAIHFLEKIGIKIKAISWNEINGNDYLLTDDFSTELKKD